MLHMMIMGAIRTQNGLHIEDSPMPNYGMCPVLVLHHVKIDSSNFTQLV